MLSGARLHHPHAKKKYKFWVGESARKLYFRRWRTMQGTNYTQASLRYQFLEDVNKVNRTVLEQLRDRVLPLFDDIRPRYFINPKRTRKVCRVLIPGVTISKKKPQIKMEGCSLPETVGNFLMLARERGYGIDVFSVRNMVTKNEARGELFKYLIELLLVREATEMHISVGEIDDAIPVPFQPYSDVTWTEIVSSSSPKLKRIRTELLSWADPPYNLACPWIFDFALQTLLTWRYDLLGERSTTKFEVDFLRKRLTLSISSSDLERGLSCNKEVDLRWAQTGYMIEIPKIPPEFRIRPLPFESPEMYERRMNEQWRVYRSIVADYWANRHPEKKACEMTSRVKNALQFLAKFQTTDSSPEDIAREFERDTGERKKPSAIMVDIHYARDLIEIPLRQNRRGPKRKNI
jgi:hypothetical protein